MKMQAAMGFALLVGAAAGLGCGQDEARRPTALSRCLEDDEIDTLMVALLVSMDASSGLSYLTGWFAAVPGSAPALPGAIDESYGLMQEDFALFRSAPFEPSPRLAEFWEALTRAVNMTDFGTHTLREGVPWRSGERPPDPERIWDAASLWKEASFALQDACFPE